MRNHDVVANELGRDQFGLVRRSQLRAAGIDHRVAARRLAAQVWTEPYPNIIDLGAHPDSWEREVFALVLAAGGGAVASHRTAAHLHGMLDIPRPRRIDVTIPRGRAHRIDGTELHSTVRLGADERHVVGGIPVTSRLRTVLDIACELDDEHLELLVADEIRGRPNAARHLARIACRRPGWPGSRRVLSVLLVVAGDAEAESVMELLGLKLLRVAGIPTPEVQGRIEDGDGRFVARGDAVWRDAWLIVEFNGRRYHDTPIRRAADAERRERLEALGWRVIVVYWEDLRPPRSDALVAAIRDHLGAP